MYADLEASRFFLHIFFFVIFFNIVTNLESYFGYTFVVDSGVYLAFKLAKEWVELVIKWFDLFFSYYLMLWNGCN